MSFLSRSLILLSMIVVGLSPVAQGTVDPATTVERFLAAEEGTPPPFPRRIVWLTIPSGESPIDWRLRQIEEAARNEPSLDVTPYDTERYFLKRMSNRRQPVTGLPLGLEQKKGVVELARKVNAELIALVWEEGGVPKMALLDATGETVATYDDPWRSPAFVAAGTADATLGATSIATEEGGEFARPWNGQFSPLLSDRSENMSLRDRVPIRRYEVDDMIQSAVVMANPSFDGVTLAYVTKSGVKVKGVDGAKLVSLGEIGVGNVTPVSVVPFDLDGDGVDELLVNAYNDEGLASAIFRYTDRRIVSLNRGLDHYFSLTADGALLAQEGMEGFPAPTMKVSRVTPEEGSLRFVAAVTMTGNEIPVGVNRYDLDGDGTYELLGAGSQGDLMLFSFGGGATWRGGDFGSTPRVVTVHRRGAGDRSYAVPPTPQVVVDPTLGPLVVMAGSRYAKRGLFSTPTLTNGTVWFVRPTVKGYVVEDAYREGEAAVVDLIPMNRGAHARNDAIGFVLKVRGLMKDSSVIVLPVQ